MCALRAADRYIRDQGMFRARRRISLAVQVSNPTRWKRLATPLSTVVKTLSNDVLDFYPLPLDPEPVAVAARNISAELRFERCRKPDCICLFSGGADSFAGAAHLLKQGRHPLFVSHAVGPVSGLQKRLFNDLIIKFKNLDPRHLVQLRPRPNTARAREQGHGLYWKPRDFLQRLRSAFFFSQAAIIARGLEANDIFMCENGLIGAAIVFAPIDDSPYTTRPAEPHFLRAMENFLRQALAMPRLAIRNPFQFMTKGEVLTKAIRLGLADSLNRTVSCWRSGNQGVRNCGHCVPCLFRQLAFSEANLPPSGEFGRYRGPIPLRKWRQWDSTELSRLKDIRLYCQKVVQGGLPYLLANELAVIDAIDITGGNAGAPAADGRQIRDEDAPRKMAGVILRFARATLQRLE